MIVSRYVLLILSVVYQTRVLLQISHSGRNPAAGWGQKVCLFEHWKHLVLYWKDIFIPLVSPLIYAQCQNPISVYSMILPRPIYYGDIKWVEMFSEGASTFCTTLLNGILLPKLFWPTVRANCSIDWEKLLKFEAEGREFSKFLRSLEQFIRTVKGQNNFW